MEWSEDSIGQLTALWAEGHSTAEIGRRLGVSKNAVVGKAHRLNLLARPSPIRRGAEAGAARPASPRRPSGLTLPSLAEPSCAAALTGEAPGSLISPDAGRRASLPPSRTEAATAPAPRPPPVAAKPAPRLSHVPPRASRVSACCWPIGEPGKPSFRFCDAEAMTGKPYCAEHAQVAYVKVRDRREEAA
jgi:GcrA cell cycle regulator